jgi:outer membrane protein
MQNGMMLRLLGALAMALAVTFATSGAAAQMKVAVIDTQRAIMETEDGLRAQATLKKLFDSRQRDLDRKQDELQKEKEEIAKQQGVLSQTALQKRVEKWQTELVELQSKFVAYNQELQQKQNELTQPIYRKTMAIISRLARQEGFDVVVDRQAVPYVRSDLDVTDRVITMYNRGGGEDDAKKEPAKAPAPAKK